MITAEIVSYLLTSIWVIAFLIIKNKLISSRGYFYLLFLMSSAGIFINVHDCMIPMISKEYSLVNILIFSILLLIAFSPWYKFDRWLKNIMSIEIKSKYNKRIRFIFIAMLLLSIYAFIYATPYAIKAMAVGASDVRGFIRDDSFYPSNMYTTICVGVGMMTPLYILAFYISMIENSLKKFRIPLFIASLTYIVTSMPFAARDGFIFIPLAHIFMFQVFKRFIDSKSRKLIIRAFLIGGSFIFVFLLIITLSRFYYEEQSGMSQIDGLISGTWGYFFQQPYVFDQTIQYTTVFQGLSKRFPLFALLFEGRITNIDPLYNFEWMFGTMFANFYSAFGWNSLFICTLFFIMIFRGLIKLYIFKRRFFSLLFIFSIYLYYLITGLFYYRLSPESITLMYLFFIILSLFLPNIFIVKRHSRNLDNKN